MSGIWIRIPHPSPSATPAADLRSYCPFCGRAQTALEHLIHAPEASICSACVQRSVDLLRDANVPEWRPRWRFWGTAKRGEALAGRGYRDLPLACSFCKLTLAEVPALVGDVRFNICSTWVGLCVDILREAPRSVAPAEEAR